MKRYLLLLAGTLLALAGTSRAAMTPWQGNVHGRVRLIVPYTVAPNHGTILLGIHFEGQPGWHLYWKDPGDAGMPPKFTWDGSTGFSNETILWPAPHKYTLPGDLIANGYLGEVVYPVRAEITGTPSHLKVHVLVYYLTCADSCIPYKYTFDLDLPAADISQPDPNVSALIDKYLSTVPAEDRQGIGLQAGLAGTPAPAPTRLGLMIFLGFLGGLILNVMPCVLPILSIKLFGLLQNSGKSRARAIADSLSSAAGIVVSFLTLAAGIILLRHTGHAIGWGIQFQQPVFVGVMALLVFAFAFNLWGFFEINLPSVFGNFAASYGQGESLIAYFMSGVFATLLATPCSAPFLGTAMGFALAQPAPIILSIFLSAGVGMALPYLALAVFPGVLKLLPKPGAWMLTLKKWLGWLMAGTGLWLVSVLYMQLHHQMTVSAPMATERLAWQRFDDATIPVDVKAGKSVFVDVTAAWCFTCKYNERFVLNSSAVASALEEPNLILMRADWTTPDPAIDAFLKRYGRAGIPFYALFRPGKSPVLLSELLTPKKVLDALAQ